MSGKGFREFVYDFYLKNYDEALKIVERIPGGEWVMQNPRLAAIGTAGVAGVAWLATAWAMRHMGVATRSADSATQLRDNYALSPEQKDLQDRVLSPPSGNYVISVVGAEKRQEGLPAFTTLHNPEGGFGEILALEEYDEKERPTGVHHYYDAETVDAFKRFFYDDKNRTALEQSEARDIRHVSTPARGDVVHTLPLAFSGFSETLIQNHITQGNLIRKNDHPAAGQISLLNAREGNVPRFGAIIEPQAVEIGGRVSEKYAVKVYLQSQSKPDSIEVDINAKPAAIMVFTNKIDAMHASHAYYGRFHHLIRQLNSKKISDDVYTDHINALPDQLMSVPETFSTTSGIDPNTDQEERRQVIHALVERDGMLSAKNLGKQALEFATEVARIYDEGIFRRLLTWVSRGYFDKRYGPKQLREHSRSWFGRTRLTLDTTEAGTDFGHATRIVHEEGIAKLRELIRNKRLRPINFLTTGYAKNATIVNYDHALNTVANDNIEIKQTHAICSYFDNFDAKPVVSVVNLRNAFYDHERNCGVRSIVIDRGPLNEEGTKREDTFYVKNRGIWNLLRATQNQADIDKAEARDYPEYMRDLFGATSAEEGKRVVLRRFDPARGQDVFYVFNSTEEVEGWIQQACKGGKDPVKLEKAIISFTKPTISESEALSLTSRQGGFVAPCYYDEATQDYRVLVIKRDRPPGTYGIPGGYLDSPDEIINPAIGVRRELGREFSINGEPVLKTEDLDRFKPVANARGIDREGHQGSTRYAGHILELNADEYRHAREKAPLVNKDTGDGEVEEAMFVPLSEIMNKRWQKKHPFHYPHELKLLVEDLNQRKLDRQRAAITRRSGAIRLPELAS